MSILDLIRKHNTGSRNVGTIKKTEGSYDIHIQRCSVTYPHLTLTLLGSGLDTAGDATTKMQKMLGYSQVFIKFLFSSSSASTAKVRVGYYDTNLDLFYTEEKTISNLGISDAHHTGKYHGSFLFLDTYGSSYISVVLSTAPSSGTLDVYIFGVSGDLRDTPTILGYAFYGSEGGYVTLNVRKYNDSSDSWSTTSTAAPSPTKYGPFAGTISFKIYVGAGSYYSSHNEYTPSSDSWSNKQDVPSPGRQDTAYRAINSKLYVVTGNISDSPYSIRDNDEYTPSGNSWTAKTDISSPRRYYSSSGVVSNKLYVQGGYYTPSWVAIKDNDEYTPSGNSWTAKTDHPSPAKYGMIGDTVSNKVYALCGGSSAGYTRTAHEYDPSGDSWSSKTSKPSPNSAVCGWFAISSHIYMFCDQQTPYTYTPSGDTWTMKSEVAYKSSVGVSTCFS